MKRLLLMVLLFALLLTSSCSEETNQEDIETEKTEENEELEKPAESESDVVVEEPEEIIDPKEEALKEIEVLKKEGYIQSNINGKYIEKDDFNLRPVSIMYDNHPYARWQAGLIKADIIYECEVEFPFTRYMAVFHYSNPEHIGPVRSARPYYLRYALEYDSVYVHVGGSNDAKSKIEDYYIANIDGLYSGNFWRYNDTGKRIPNNMYTDMDNMREAQSSYGYRTTGEYKGYDFNDISKSITEELEPEACSNLNIIFNQHYEIEFLYDEESQNYLRYVNGEKHIDEFYQEEIRADNIIVILTKKHVLDDVGRLAIDTVGQGDGVYLTQGEKVNITWKKDTYNAKTYFYYNDGQELVFNPGQTWIEITTQDTNINYNEE